MNINDLKDILLKENHSLVIYKNNASVITSNDRGVNSLIKFIEEDKSQLSGSLIADKVIGKAAALLMIYAGVKEIYAPIISKPALQTLLKHNVKIYYDKEVERIINRKGDGLCPMETLCLDIEKPEEAYLLLSTK
ncbi:MAG: DUF1893 domain-containing protein [Lentimicrobiaceae bacterium]|nr:DUF1893 domain-containing protein [Lentimicrobiaceae bacterium]